MGWYDFYCHFSPLLRTAVRSLSCTSGERQRHIGGLFCALVRIYEYGMKYHACVDLLLLLAVLFLRFFAVRVETGRKSQV